MGNRKNRRHHGIKCIHWTSLPKVPYNYWRHRLRRCPSNLSWLWRAIGCGSRWFARYGHCQCHMQDVRCQNWTFKCCRRCSDMPELPQSIRMIVDCRLAKRGRKRGRSAPVNGFSHADTMCVERRVRPKPRINLRSQFVTAYAAACASGSVT